ncbi:Calcium load-activated calcium channel [Dimargaris cristalligena]|uniref:Integral membrane protein DUF106-domain-containing protein n=1 Tax=Dimargaris cristalligena TaxID=215637 RepID=A0A4P9ZTZ5_9FUNG|nr:Calcium load-activated calcium channel [Dimargaris cristalligena]RKP36987.1 integral membrane protein DUF106-domain-containing protein [Dimargaris cristalligena]|eukprot:RKP36987.1 integral membrane protein DUF106-domain-containing protein [Dimargaris cristalligena]
MLGSMLVVLLFAVGNSALAEYMGYRLVYSTEDYQFLKESLARTQKRLAQEEDNDSGTGNPKRRERRLEELRKQIKTNQSRASGMTMRLSLMTAALQIAAFYVLGSVLLPGVTVAKLPFEPFGLVQGLSHRGLEGDNPTDCSPVFLFVVASLFTKAAIQRYFNLSIRQASAFAAAFEQAKETSL